LLRPASWLSDLSCSSFVIFASCFCSISFLLSTLLLQIFPLHRLLFSHVPVTPCNRRGEGPLTGNRHWSVDGPPLPHPMRILSPAPRLSQPLHDLSKWSTLMPSSFSRSFSSLPRPPRSCLPHPALLFYLTHIRQHATSSFIALSSNFSSSFSCSYSPRTSSTQPLPLPLSLLPHPPVAYCQHGCDITERISVCVETAPE
jgi:hypothetical protein